VRAAYRMVISAWGRVEIIMFGPVGRENRFERLFFWPDRRSIGQRQVRAILRNRDRDAIDPARLAEKSVAVQGLTALEILLHGDGSDRLATTPRDEFRCAYARAIVRNLTGIVGAIREDWADDGAFTAIWRNPGPANPAYLFGRETTLELVKAFDQALENVRDRRIAPAIGFGPLRRVHRPVLWRSRLTMPLLHANLAGAHDLFNEGGLAAAYLARMQRSQEAVSGIAGITSELKLMRDATASLAAKADPFASPDIKSRLAAIGFPLRNVRKQAVDRLKEAAGLSVGFNASDGD
jgi:predicted lipoprotein